MKKISDPNLILKSLEGNDLTIKQLSQDIGKDEAIIRTNVCRLQKKGLIEKTGKCINRYRVFTLKEKKNNDGIDTKIVRKMINPFIENSLEIKLTEKEIERIKELYEGDKSD